MKYHGTRQWLRSKQVVVIAAVALIGSIAGSGTASAVHDLGVFQLDANASTAVNPAPTALEDWDLICKANPGQCTFAPGYTQPSGTTVAKPNTFVKDPSESATDDILKGGTKDDNDIDSWKWTSAKPSPPKNDLTDGYAAQYTCKGSETNSVASCSGTTGDKLLYFGADRLSNNGSANIAFWFFQGPVAATPSPLSGTTCNVSAGCPFSGLHTAGNVSLGGTTPGDILVISAFGPKAAINVYEWVGPGKATKDYLGGNSCFTSVCTLQPLFVGGQDCPSVTADNACAVVNSVSTPSPWVLPQKGTPANSFAPTNFFEGGLNLTKLGEAGGCFSSFLINTRASAAGDAELHDKISGQFAQCKPTLTTQASTNATVQPGTAVHDTATITITGATSPADATGTVTFFLCGPNASANPDCSTGGTNVGTGGLSGGANATDGVSTAVSPDVNTGTGLANGYYCFRAVWPGDIHYPGAQEFTDSSNECFSVLQLGTQTVTHPQSPSGTDVSGPLALNASVVDHAVVTGSSLGGTPSGTVSFSICNPSQVTGSAGSEVCASGNGTALAGNPVTATAIVGSDPPQSEATSSPAVVANQLGVWCFRATYTPDVPFYTGSSDANHNECFTVTTTSSALSQQTWVPNDHFTISTVGGVALNGTLAVTLRSGTCNGTVVYTDPLTGTVSAASGTGFDTTNNGATPFTVDTANAGTYFWSIVFTPSSPYIAGVTKCETSTVTINNNP
jgi:hypothetical protein